MSSAFNLSTLAAMQEQRVEQVSVHFWRCQLTREQPRFDWHPDRMSDEQHHQQKIKNGNGTEENADQKNGKDGKHEDEAVDDHHHDDDSYDNATRHLLHVTGCVLGPKATGIHLVTVRTGNQHKKPIEKPATEGEASKNGSAGGEEATPSSSMSGTPILCIDPASQRTLALGHEFVLETGGSNETDAPAGAPGATPSSCTFELVEGDGPVWLTGTHRIHRVVPLVGPGDDEEEEEEEEENEAEEEEAEADEEEEDIEDEEMEEDDEEEAEDEEAEEEEDEDEEEEKTKKKKPAAKSKAAAKKPAAKKQAKKPQQQKQTTAAQSRRKRAKPDS